MLLFDFDKTEHPYLITRIRWSKLNWCPHYNLKIIFYKIKNLPQIWS